MAHAARLNLRMQKELKLLLTDPPPNATFPCLSEQEQSLTSIDARLKGPEGTAYADGVFNLNIQIPERYPFQPPMVKFTTPLYHPNIDNGGRICLDILNLPPKGTWQPSLNISTVITSIGLLLSEPNPDDGLMHEASMDYKYNNQAFEQKARTMTEKYARTREAESSKGVSGSETPTHPITEHTEIVESSVSTNEQLRCHKRLHGISRKLSLDSSGSSSKRESDKLISGTRSSSDKHVEPGWFKEPKVVIEHSENPNCLQLITRSDNEKKKTSQCMQEGKENVAPRQYLHHQLQDQSDALHMMSSSTSSDDDIIRKPRKQLKLFNATTKKLVPSKPLSQVLGCATNLTLHTRGSSNLDSKLVIASSAANSDDSKLENNRDCKVNCAKLEKMSKHSSPISAAEALIVLDSEDSDEGEDVMQSMRSKLSLRRRHKRLSRTS